MRIPVSKIYRAFPELDQFTDSECEMYVERARSRRLQSGSLMAFGAAGAGIATLVVMGFITLTVVIPLGRGLGMRGSVEHDMEWGALAVGVHIVAAFMVGYMVRDAWLRKAIRGCIDAARCPSCDYSLLGLPVVHGAVKCPECGSALDLAASGLMPEDMLSRMPSAPPTTRDG